MHPSLNPLVLTLLPHNQSVQKIISSSTVSSLYNPLSNYELLPEKKYLFQKQREKEITFTSSLPKYPHHVRLGRS